MSARLEVNLGLQCSDGQVQGGSHGGVSEHPEAAQSVDHRDLWEAPDSQGQSPISSHWLCQKMLSN